MMRVLTTSMGVDTTAIEKPAIIPALTRGENE
jgi:hypothetical protein